VPPAADDGVTPADAVRPGAPAEAADAEPEVAEPDTADVAEPAPAEPDVAEADTAEADTAEADTAEADTAEADTAEAEPRSPARGSGGRRPRGTASQQAAAWGTGRRPARAFGAAWRGSAPSVVAALTRCSSPWSRPSAGRIP